jgi:hypothetical protein
MSMSAMPPKASRAHLPLLLDHSKTLAHICLSYSTTLKLLAIMPHLTLESAVFDTFATLTWFSELGAALTDAKTEEVVAKMVTTWRRVLVSVCTMLWPLFFTDINMLIDYIYCNVCVSLLEIGILIHCFRDFPDWLPHQRPGLLTACSRLTRPRNTSSPSVRAYTL